MSSGGPNTLDPIGVALALGGATFFSAKGIFIKLAYLEGVDTETTLALRMVIAVPLYLAILAVVLATNPDARAKLSPRTILFAMAVGALGYYVASWLDFAGLAYVTAQYGRLVLLTYPFFTVILGVLFFGDTMKKGLFSSLAICWLGLALIFGWNLTVNPDGIVLGTLLVLGAAITFALYQHLAKRVMVITGALLFTCIGSSAAGFGALTHLQITNGLDQLATLTPKVWLIGLGLGLFSTILPTFMLNAAISRVGARVTSAAGTFGPVMTIILAIIVLGEPFTLWHLVGSSLVILGAMRFGRAEQKSAA